MKKTDKYPSKKQMYTILFAVVIFLSIADTKLDIAYNAADKWHFEFSQNTSADKDLIELLLTIITGYTGYKAIVTKHDN